MSRKPPVRLVSPPYALVTYPLDGTQLFENADFARDLEEAKKALRDAGGNPDDLGGAAWCWNQARKKEQNRRKAVGGKKGAEKTKKKAQRRHKKIAAKLAEGQHVKAVQIELEKAGKKKASERTIRRVKKAKSL